MPLHSRVTLLRRYAGEGVAGARVFLRDASRAIGCIGLMSMTLTLHTRYIDSVFLSVTA